MHDLLFESPDALENDQLAQFAADLDLEVARFMVEVETGSHARRVREDYVSGLKSGVEGTPALFINGVRYDGGLLFSALLRALKDSEAGTGD